MFELIKELHTIASRENLKLAPKKSFYMLLKVKFLGHEIGNNTIKPTPSKIEAIKRIPSPKEKKDVMQFLGSVNFYSKFIEKLHINLKPLYTLLHDDVKFQWTPELEKIFQNVKNAMTADTELTIPNTTHPFFITVDASLVGLGAVLFQMNEENKMKVISYNSRILNTQEQIFHLWIENFSQKFTHYKYMNFCSLDLLILYTSSQITSFYYIVLQRKEILVLDFIEHKCN